MNIYLLFNNYIIYVDFKDLKPKRSKKTSKLPGGVLVTVISFMTVEELLGKISKLSRSNREMLLKD